MANLYRASNPISNELQSVRSLDYVFQKGDREDPIVLDDDEDYDLTGGQSQSSSPVRGTRENPVVLDGDEDYGLSHSQSQSSSGRSTRENPVVLDNDEDHYQSQNIGPSVHINDQDKFICKVCFNYDVDLSLRCGHVFCYTCINEWFHGVIYGLDAPQQYPVKASCPACRTKIFGYHTPPAYHKTRETMGFFSLTCPNAEHRDCFLEQYMVPGTRLKFL